MNIEARCFERSKAVGHKAAGETPTIMEWYAWTLLKYFSLQTCILNESTTLRCHVLARRLVATGRQSTGMPFRNVPTRTPKLIPSDRAWQQLKDYFIAKRRFNAVFVLRRDPITAPSQ